jgi:hypothetical protein
VEVDDAPDAGCDDMACAVVAREGGADELPLINADAKASCGREGVHLCVYCSAKLCEGAKAGALYCFEKGVQLRIRDVD